MESGNEPSAPPSSAAPATAPFTVAVLTISDGCHAGERADLSGPAVADLLQAAGFRIVRREVLPDDRGRIAERLRQLAGRVDAVVTTGGTGLGPRDVTPEATLDAAERLVPGLAELMRQTGGRETARAWLSRGVVATRGATLLLNLPGSPRGAIESLHAVFPLLPHALELLRGHTQH